MPRRSGSALALVLVLVSALAVAAPEVRVESLVPAGAGAWELTLGGDRAAKLKDRIAVRVDGNLLAATATVVANGRLQVRATDVPPDARWLEVGVGSGKTFDAAAALFLVPPVPGPHDDWLVYHVYLATFRNGDTTNDGAIRGWRDPRYAGGDLAGVISSLDHVKALGANAIWISPAFAAPSSHGYDVSNYFRIGDAVGVAGDPKASMDVFRRLVRAAREKGIRIVLDLPLNHAARSYDMENGDPKELKPKSTGARQDAEKLWESWGATYRFWNFDDANTRRFLTDAALFWLREEGVAGLRLDYVRGVPHDYWAEFRAAVDAAAPGTYVVGECWKDEGGALANATEIARYYAPVGSRPQFGSLLDFPLQAAMTEVFARGGAATQLEETLQASAALYGPEARPTWFLDNHDMARFMDWADDPRRLEAAIGFMAALSGPQVLFYGTETGLSGSGRKPGFTDAGRIPMPWDKLDRKLIERTGAIHAARRAHPALVSGARWPVMADKTALVMAKVAPGEVALVGVNLAREPRVVELDAIRWFPGGTPPESVVGSSSVVLDGGKKIARWTLPPLSTSIVVTPAR